MSGRGWPPKQIAMLKQLWDEGMPSQGIANKLSMIGPTRTKNSVVGLAHRMNLPSRESPIRPLAPGAVRTRPLRPMAPPLGTLPPAAAEGVKQAEAPPEPPRQHERTTAQRGLQTILGHARVRAAPPVLTEQPPERPAPVIQRGTCQWPLNDGRPWRFCEQPRDPYARAPYCPHHAEKARAKIRAEDEGDAA